jgi:methylmalonyl-CoA mutase C-terminal domain/subunit
MIYTICDVFACTQAYYHMQRKEMTSRKARILIAKPGLDGHDRGAKVVARGLSEAGYEVIYTGLHQTPEQVAEAALQEDAEAVGLSILSGAHMTIFPRVKQLLDERGGEDILVFGGGIIPEEDIEELKGQGVHGIFTPGTPISEIVTFLEEALSPEEK